MQKIATKIFIYSSITFAVLGVVMVIAEIDPGDEGGAFSKIVTKVFLSSIFVILASFALSVAGKYLGGGER